MMRFTTFSIFAATIALVNAHGSISVPKVVFQDPPNKNAPSCLPKGPAGPYNGDHVLKDLADQNGSRCGKTDGNAPVQPIPADGIVKFDISAQHIGPCEIWLDNDRVVYEKECWTAYPNHQIPVDFSKCKSGKCQLRWVWLATHNSPWEVFDNCVNVGTEGGGDSNSKPPMRPVPAPGLDPQPIEPKPEAPATRPKDDSEAPGTVKPSIRGSSTYKGKNGATSEWCSNNCARGYCPTDFCEGA